MATSTRRAAAPCAFTTAEMQALLAAHHQGSEWVYMMEVAPQTGGGTRYADGVAVNLWKSRGYVIHGFEIKISRGDWLRELKLPQKAEEVFSYCDHWWVVAPPGVVRPEELPPGWGWMEPVPRTQRAQPADPGLELEPVSPASAQPDSVDMPVRLVADEYRLAVKVKGASLHPKPVSREFFASLMRRAHESLDRVAQQRFALERALLMQDTEAHIRREVARRSERLESLQSSIREFEERTGLSMHAWNGPPIDVIQLAQKLHALQGRGEDGLFLGQITTLLDQLHRCSHQLEQAVAQARDTLAETPIDGSASPASHHPNDPIKESNP